MWTIALMIGLVGMSLLLAILGKFFSKEQVAIKTLLMMLSLSFVIIIAAVVRLLVNANAGATTITQLNSLATRVEIIAVILFVFFVSYFFIIYTINNVRALKEAKKQKMEI